MRRPFALLMLLAAVASMGAQYRTTNFVVNAADQQTAELVGKWAEHYRKEKAILWLGKEMPTWGHPCPLQVTVNMQGPSGATSFQFSQGRIDSMHMQIQGPLERLVHSVLPHEVTHTVFAYQFRTPVPRWADEGGSVLSEDDLERGRHDQLARSILAKGQQIPLRTLFGLREYPPQVMCLYAQGYSMTDYLVKRSNRGQFLNFVGRGMSAGWDTAVREYYGHKSVEELEQAWFQHLRDTRKQPGGVQLAANTNATAPAQPVGGAGNRVMVHLTAPPVQPLEPAPVVRGAMPTNAQAGQTFGQRRPTHLPDWQPTGVTLHPPVTGNPAPAPFPPAVQLLPPQTGPYPATIPPGASPVGFPR